MSRETARLPGARPSSDFLVEMLADEVLVYDQREQRAHCLSPAAALVWRACCDGKTMAEAEAVLASAGHGDSLEVVLQHLGEAGFLAAKRAPARRVNQARRAMLGRTMVAGAVLASPVVFSIVAPSVASAASVCGQAGFACCAQPPQCTDGSLCKNGKCQ